MGLNLLIALITTACFYQTVISQEPISRIIYEGEKHQPVLIASFTERSVVYGSVRDIARGLLFDLYRSEETGKIELKDGPYRLKLTPQNPYVVLTDISLNSQSIYHLPVDVIAAGNDLFAPLGQFVSILQTFIAGEIQYIPNERSLLVRRVDRRKLMDITGITVEERKNGYLIRLKAERSIADFSGFYREDGWLYVTLVGARVDPDVIKRFQPKPPIRRIVTEPSPSSFQFSFLVSRDIQSTDIFRDPQNNDIIIALHKKVDPAEIAQTHMRHNRVEENLARERDRWKLDVIVIDPGHGGRDPGTIGTRGVREKDVTLTISKQLGELIEKNMPGTRAVLTRTTDEFVELYRRGQIANEAGGKLFISIHANSMPRKPSPQRGFEIYLLRPGRTEEAIRIAERENSVIRFEEDYEIRYAHLTDENFILVTMAHSAYLRYSELFADILQRKVSEHTTVANRGVRQAGFWVLVGASMPGVLVEVGYLSNPDEERFLASKAGQQQIADAIFRAVKRYSEEYASMFATPSVTGSN